MDDSVGIRELKQHVSTVLKRVLRGEAIIVTDRGNPIARIVPLQPSVLEQLILEGRVVEATGDLLAVADEMGLPFESLQPMLPSEALAELRNDER